MRRLWEVVSFVAVVNVLTAAGLVAWLWSGDRLDLDRVAAIRAMLSTTLTDAQAADAALAAEADANALAAAEAMRRQNPPLSSEGQVALELLASERTREANRRLREETMQLQESLDLRSRQLDGIEQDLRDRAVAWDASISEELRRRTDEQFQKTLGLYEALAGKQAKAMLLELVQQGRLEQAVAYLDAMSTRAATRTLKEMTSDEENELATQLLESIRVLGIEAEVAELPGNGDALPSR